MYSSTLYNIWLIFRFWIFINDVTLFLLYHKTQEENKRHIKTPNSKNCRSKNCYKFTKGRKICHFSSDRYSKCFEIKEKLTLGWQCIREYHAAVIIAIFVHSSKFHIRWILAYIFIYATISASNSSVMGTVDYVHTILPILIPLQPG